MFVRRAVFLTPKGMRPVLNKTGKVCRDLARDFQNEHGERVGLLKEPEKKMDANYFLFPIPKTGHFIPQRSISSTYKC